MKTALALLVLCSFASAQTKQTTPAPSKSTKPAAKATTKAKAKGPDLMNPASLNAKAPDLYIVQLQTTKGNIVIRVSKNWAPIGADRFYNLVRAGFYDNTYFFRVLDFMAQVGMSSNPAISKIWAERTMLDDRPIQSNTRGMVTFAAGGAKNSRSTQFFINRINNSRLDNYPPSGFAPFGEVVEGMEIVDQIYGGYREDPDQGEIATQGEAYLNRYFPRLDKIIKAVILPMPGSAK